MWNRQWHIASWRISYEIQPQMRTELLLLFININARYRALLLSRFDALYLRFNELPTDFDFFCFFFLLFCCLRVTGLYVCQYFHFAICPSHQCNAIIFVFYFWFSHSLNCLVCPLDMQKTTKIHRKFIIYMCDGDGRCQCKATGSRTDRPSHEWRTHTSPYRSHTHTWNSFNSTLYTVIYFEFDGVSHVSVKINGDRSHSLMRLICAELKFSNQHRTTTTTIERNRKNILNVNWQPLFFVCFCHFSSVGSSIIFHFHFFCRSLCVCVCVAHFSFWQTSKELIKRIPLERACQFGLQQRKKMHFGVIANWRWHKWNQFKSIDHCAVSSSIYLRIYREANERDLTDIAHWK